MKRQKILIFPIKNAIKLNYLHNLLLFIAGAAIAIITLCIGKGDFTTREFSYAFFTLRSDMFEDCSLISSFVLVLKQSLIDLIPLCLVAPTVITVISRSLLSAILIVKGFISIRHIGAIIHICNHSEKPSSLSHPTMALFLSLITAVILNALLVYLCTKADLYNDIIIRHKDSSTSIILTSDTSKFIITFLTVLGTVIIISIFKSILLYLTSLI